MKRALLILLACFVCLSLCSCQSLLKKAKAYVTGAEESEPPSDFLESRVSDDYSYDVYKSYIKLTGYLGEETVITLPSELDGRPVTVIGALTFFERAKVTSVTIPDSVTAIEESAFYYADALTSIVIPDSVTSIGTRAFAWCNELSSVRLGAGITAIPDYCFNHCASLESVNINANITKIGVRAFSYCDSLAELTLPYGVESVGERAISYCGSLEYVTFAGVSTELGDALFEGSDNVTVIAPKGSTAMTYCAEHGLRWSTSKSIEASVPGEGEDDSSGESDESGDISE